MVGAIAPIAMPQFAPRSPSRASALASSRGRAAPSNGARPAGSRSSEAEQQDATEAAELAIDRLEPSCDCAWRVNNPVVAAAVWVISRFSPAIPFTLNICQSLGRPLAAAGIKLTLCEVVEHDDAVGELRGIMVGQQQAAGSDEDVPSSASAPGPGRR